MSRQKRLEEFSIDELLKEVKSRSSKQESVATSCSVGQEALSDFKTNEIIEVLTSKQEVIYGTDNRMDIFQVTDQAIIDDADSVVALFDVSDIVNNGNGTSTLKTQNFGRDRNLCQNEKFREQPTGAFCSGFLVAPNIIATAGHCVNAGNVTNIRFVFGFRMIDASTVPNAINNTEIYKGLRLIGREEEEDGPDWALVQLDRPVTNHQSVRIRRAGKIEDNQAVHVIGHPVGIPTKFAGGADVRENNQDAFFIANLDTYGGNSGSPVFNSDTHEVEGILVRGETDFVGDGNCNISLVCPTTGCRGEDCTRTTEFANHIPTIGD
ncbi:serine protease [Priestia megaterium]|nr:serine protease [Priestia megaterium]PFK90922.1 serine protease [Priestia megaterium]